MNNGRYTPEYVANLRAFATRHGTINQPHVQKLIAKLNGPPPTGQCHECGADTWGNKVICTENSRWELHVSRQIRRAEEDR